jgi:hypothetical protein
MMLVLARRISPEFINRLILIQSVDHAQSHKDLDNKRRTRSYSRVVDSPNKIHSGSTTHVSQFLQFFDHDVPKPNHTIMVL